jgi:type IV secretion system protein VirB10
VRSQISAAGSDPSAAYQARLAQLRASGVGGQQAGGGMGGGAPQLLQTAGGGGARTTRSSRKRPGRPLAAGFPARSAAHAVRAARRLRGAGHAHFGINSDLPGQIMAQVAQNVYDTPTGKHLLIPQGSRLVGSYSSDVAYGQSRVLVAWQRIVFPDGKAMDIGTMPGADSAGYAGFNDQVNNHYLRLFGSAFLMSGVTPASPQPRPEQRQPMAHRAPAMP